MQINSQLYKQIDHNAIKKKNNSKNSELLRKFHKTLMMKIQTLKKNRN